MKRRLELTLAGFLAIATPARDLLAADRVVVIAETPLTVRMQAELAQLGIDTVPMARPAGSDPTVLETLAEDHEAIATILLERKPNGMEIWIADRTTEKMVLRRIPVEGGAGSDATAVTKSVELLRASLLEVRMTPTPAPTPPVVDRILGPALLPPASSPSVMLRLSPTVLFGTQAPPSAHLTADVGFLVGDYFVLGATLVPPTFAATSSASEGELSLSHGLGLFVVELHPFPESRWLDPRVSSGLGLHLAHVGVEGSAGRPNGEDLSASAYANLSLGLAVWVADPFAIDAELGCGLTLPRTDYSLEGRVAASIGWPLCTGSLGAGFRF
jgi:hypothetical protein